MAISLVQTKSGGSGAYTASFNFTITSNIVVGNTLLINITAGNADVQPTLSDGLGNTYTMDANTSNPTSATRQSWLFRANITTGGSCTVTVSYSAGSPDTAYITREYSGLVATSPLDVTSAANDGNNFVQTHPAGTTGTTAQASELVILFGGCAVGSDPVLVAGTGYGHGLEQKGFDTFTYAFMSDNIVSSTGTQTGNFTSTGFVEGQAGIATYKAALGSVDAMFQVHNVPIQFPDYRVFTT
jgi:hypothetical protein